MKKWEIKNKWLKEYYFKVFAILLWAISEYAGSISLSMNNCSFGWLPHLKEIDI